MVEFLYSSLLTETFSQVALWMLEQAKFCTTVLHFPIFHVLPFLNWGERGKCEIVTVTTAILSEYSAITERTEPLWQFAQHFEEFS